MMLSTEFNIPDIRRAARRKAKRTGIAMIICPVNNNPAKRIFFGTVPFRR
jgi:hypothetical protein